MLAELAIANAAFSVIKEAVANSGDIMNAGQALFQYFDSKAEIQKKASAKMQRVVSVPMPKPCQLEQGSLQPTRVRSRWHLHQVPHQGREK
jgi:hypothetical protein